ncbi:MAG: ABC transporter substrate-binding protein [Balneolaceae bacterium]
MKQISALLFFTLIWFSTTLQAQQFEEGLELFERQQFEEAIERFQQVDTDRARLFSGKSYFSLSHYPEARALLRPLADHSETALRHESQFTLALIHFRQRNYAQSIDGLYTLSQERSPSGVQVDARRLYRQILQFLTTSERFDVLRQTAHAGVRSDLANASRGQIDAESYRLLTDLIIREEPDSTRRQQLREQLRDDAGDISRANRYPVAPEGMVYNLGVLLPTFDDDPRSPNFQVSRQLMYGITLAAEEFNTRHSNKKARVIFEPSGQEPDSAAAAFLKLALAERSDLVIGPLFSETAAPVAELSEAYQLPMIAPLANSDDINLDFNYAFQLNPTFEIHGLRMARFAVQQLGLDSLSVIAQSNALGTASARAFRHEAERLGATISYYFEEDFASMGYDLTRYTNWFDTDPELVDSLRILPSQGIYAPFTGQAANTLISLLTTDLEVLGNRAVLLGSEEWSEAALSSYQRNNFEIYYSQAFGSAADSSAIAFMENDFENRFGERSDRFAKIGYDAATVALNSLDQAGNPAYAAQVLRRLSPYRGMAMPVHFDGKRVNQQLFIRPLSVPAIQKANANPGLFQLR